MSRRTFFDAAGSSGHPAPSLLYEVDLTAHGNVGALTPNASVTIDGKEWYFRRSDATVSAALDETDGLSMQTTALSVAQSGFLMLPLSEIGAAEYFGRRPIIVTYHLEHTIPTTQDGSKVIPLAQLDATGGARSSQWLAALYRSRFAGTQGWNPTAFVVGVEYPVYGSAVASHDVAADVKCHVLRGTFDSTWSVGAWTGGTWPAPEDMASISDIRPPLTTWPAAAAAGMPPTPSEIAIGFGVESGPIAPTPDFPVGKLKRLKVEVF